MPQAATILPSCDLAAASVVDHLRQRHDTALVAPPGCGATTLVQTIAGRLRDYCLEPCDLRTPRSAEEAAARLANLKAPPPTVAGLVLVVDHASSLPPEQFKAWVQRVMVKARELSATCLWVGSLDSRAIASDLGVRINGTPRSHIAFPMLSRDELLGAYRNIAERNGCRWGEAILFLLLDFCGTDLALVESISQYLHGDWNQKLYDDFVWDRVGTWLTEDPVVNGYRQRFKLLPPGCRHQLNLLRLGGKLECPRPDLADEIDDDRRALCLRGFLAPNLLPGFYQARNLTARLIIHEPSGPWADIGPASLYRRAMNERASQLVQDTEVMLRTLVFDAFHRLGDARVEEILRGMKGEREMISSELQKKLIGWARDAGTPDLQKGLTSLLIEENAAFRTDNTAWATAMKMMADDSNAAPNLSIPAFLRCIDYLTFSQLVDLVIGQQDTVFPSAAVDPTTRSRLKDRWRDCLGKIRRLRNDVAHLRNVSFKNMEDLAGTVETLRHDVIKYGQWQAVIPAMVQATEEAATDAGLGT